MRPVRLAASPTLVTFFSDGGVCVKAIALEPMASMKQYETKLLALKHNVFWEMRFLRGAEVKTPVSLRPD